ncbi:unnamed protein product [Paramecium pentaurelia]|uniref:Uncharacterized protein n=1 Tax=Paramecium pentaurelia TaxID=43138 RepID=A0A8S1WD36_9CILI|nr:unnamed protein product [Paramecium pentaurelia]
MTFLWADIPFEWTCLSLRYHNDMLWYIWSLIQMIPVFVAGFYQLYKHQTTPDYYHKIKKGTWDQFIVMFFAAPVPLYYLIDLTISIVEGTFFEPCRFWLWFHHMVSMIVIPALILRNEYEWQDTMIMATHTLLMKYPFIFLFNILYVGLVFYYNILLYFSPLNEKWVNRFLGKFFPFIYYSFIVLLVHDCNNALPFLY